MKNKIVTVSSFGTFSLSTFLGFLFLTLKLTHVIDWSWFWVLCPFWISLAFSGFILLCIICFVLVISVSALIFGRR